MLSIRELEVFRRVMELGTITAAAEALHISQPAVSRTLQQAERRLGFPLFLRRKKRLLATPEAQSLFPETVSAFAAFDVVQKRAADLQAGRAGGLNIAAISAFANALLPAAVAKFRQSRPGVVITLQSMSALQVATHVANHQADLGIRHRFHCRARCVRERSLGDRFRMRDAADASVGSEASCRPR